MLQALINIFKIPELRNRVLFSLGMLAIYRIGFWIPLPAVNQDAMIRAAEKAAENQSGFGKFLQ